MTDDASRYEEISTADELRALLGPVSPRAAVKYRSSLHPLQVQWIEASPFCLVATSDGVGRCDVSPKGDPAGSTLVLDERTLAIPERPGNHRGDGFHNILENPHVGLIYLIPGRTDTLRVNGRARILRDAPFFDRLTTKGHRPKLALLVEIEEIFFHCAKAFLRSGLWQPETWDPQRLPPVADIAHTLLPNGSSLEDLQVYYGEATVRTLYRDD